MGMIVSSVLFVIAIVQTIRFVFMWVRHRQRMRELDAIDKIVAKAARAKDVESYEFYMVEATRRLTEYSEKYP